MQLKLDALQRQVVIAALSRWSQINDGPNSPGPNSPGFSRAACTAHKLISEELLKILNEEE